MLIYDQQFVIRVLWNFIADVRLLIYLFFFYVIKAFFGISYIFICICNLIIIENVYNDVLYK